MGIVDLYESSKHRNNVAHFSAIVNLAMVDGDLNEDEEKLVNRLYLPNNCYLEKQNMRI